jgi:hypothetical protein
MDREKVQKIMADIIDLANDIADADRERCINSARLFKAPVGIGMCLNCDADVAGDNRWCDTDCQEDWAKRNRVGVLRA